MKRLLLLVPSTTYRTTDFVRAATQLDVELVVGTEQSQSLEKISGGTQTFDFKNPVKGSEQIEAFSKKFPLDAIVAVDDGAVMLAARSS